MNKYNNSKIYKLSDNTSENIYIGSTIQTLQQRLQGHKSSAKSCKDGFGCGSKKIIDGGDYKIELLEEFSCENKKELCQKEQKYLDLHSNLSLVNKVKSHNSPEDIKGRYWNHREKILLAKKQYDSVYHKCECGGGYCMSHRARHQNSKKCKEYFNKNNPNQKSFLYQVMSGEITLLSIIKRLCKEKNLPITNKQLQEITKDVNKKTGEENPNLIYSDDEEQDQDFDSESEDESEDYDEGDMIEETFTIGRTKDGHYVIM